MWVLGEYSERVPKVAPDVLRKMAKNFTQEETEVKMQVLNLATKLVLVNPEQTELLAQVPMSSRKFPWLLFPFDRKSILKLSRDFDPLSTISLKPLALKS